jgi:hypothetical protein
MRKYKLTDETIQITRNGVEVTLHQIEALRDFGVVKAGEKGGFIEREANLSHDGDCWVYDTAKIYDNAKVYGNAWIFGCAEVYDTAEVYDNANIYGCAKVYGTSKVYGDIVLSK